MAIEDIVTFGNKFQFNDLLIISEQVIAIEEWKWQL